MISEADLDESADLRADLRSLSLGQFLNSFPPLSIDQSTNVNCTNNHFVFSLLVEGVPYNVRVFAENGVGNGTFCIITDFGNEER